MPSYIMVKANDGTLGCTPEGCKALSQFVNVFISENLFGSLGRAGAKGGCSSLVYYNPRVILKLWGQVEMKDWEKVDETCEKIGRFFDYLDAKLPSAYTDTNFDRIGGVASGFLKMSLYSRGPYPIAAHADVDVFRHYYAEHFPDMLEL